MSNPRKVNLDTALAEWPHVEKPETEWDERARSVMERLRRGERGATAAYVSEDDLFADPLAAIEAEERAAFASRERDRKQLQELAKMALSESAVTPPPAPVETKIGHAKGEDSGLIHLAAASAAVESAPVIATPSVGAAVPAPPPSNVVPITLRDPRRKKSPLGIVIGTVFALSAVAAGTFLFLQLNKQPVTVATMTQPTQNGTAATQAPTAPPEAKTSEAAIDPNALPAAEPTVAVAPKASGHQPSSSAIAIAPKENKDAPGKVAQKDLPTSPASPNNNDLGDGIRKSVGAPSSEIPLQPAAAPSGMNAASGSVPTKPSSGAVAGAIGAVLPAARDCLGPDDPISRAQIVFNSDGSVRDVTVSGAAAGKPTEACIKNALSKAKLPPFADASYTAPITIRHK